MRIAIVGSGVAGLVSAHLLHPGHDVTIFEADARIGGHVNTVTVPGRDGDHRIDTGFIVFNEPNYPGLTRLLEKLDVPSQPSDMSFSVSCMATGLEYRGSGVNTLFSQRRNLVRPGFLRMLRDVTRFNSSARELLRSDDITTTLRDFVDAGGYSRQFIDHYLVPLGSSIWSADPNHFTDFPAASLVRFFDRHGLLSLSGRPEWRTVAGGSSRYVDALVAPMRDRFRTSSPVHRVERDDDGVSVWSPGVDGERFERIIFACHADQALRILGSDASAEEREVLGAFRFQHNRATLHTDARLLPRRRRAWASWNYQHITDAAHRNATSGAALTYHANRLQAIDAPEQYCTTLNRDEVIAPERVIASYDYTHPIFNTAAMAAQRRRADVNGQQNTYYCGAYWGYGFHEDGVQSALDVAGHFNASL